MRRAPFTLKTLRFCFRVSHNGKPLADSVRTTARSPRMSMRRAVAAATGVLLGMSALTLTASPAYAADSQDTTSDGAPTVVAHR
jgi:hypothetical protein